MKLIRYADPFWGCEAVKLPSPEGIAKTWYPIKAMLGGTDPGAARPFGQFSCSPYTGGYSSGYGNYDVTYGGEPTFFEDRPLFRGVTHDHQSGIGYLGKFFNYVKTTPHLTVVPKPQPFGAEQAIPGYYACTLQDGTKCELTVGEKGAMHRYTFAADGGQITVDLSHNGLSRHLNRKTYTVPTYAKIEQCTSDLLIATVTLEGVRLAIAVRCDGAKDCRLWQGDPTQSGDRIPDLASPFGCTFALQGREAVVSVTMTLDAAASMAQLECLTDFDRVKAEAYHAWEDAFSHVEIEGDQDTLTTFASAYYHSLLKPADWSGDGFLKGDCLLDLCTLWDQYKTQLPLVLTLFPQTGKKLMHTFLSLSEMHGHFPNTVTLTTDTTLESLQARGLAELVIADAYYRDLLPKEELYALLQASLVDLFRPENEDFFQSGNCEYATHVLDLCDACSALLPLAEALDETEIADKLRKFTSYWEKSYGEDGLLRSNSPYYEGTRHNYSFRLLACESGRIRRYGADTYLAHLDRFFGFTHPEDTSARFEGFNNETDMETPYAYHALGEFDRLCEVLDAQHRYCFRPGRNGAPGNVDSGAMSSCYVWNTLGLFPVAGQDRILLGRPAVRSACLHLPNADLKILSHGTGVHVIKVCYQGQDLPDRRITVRQLMQGGIVEFFFD